MKVGDIMTRAVRRVSVDANLNDALAQMWEGDVGALPVVDDEGVVVGMVTDRDAAMAMFLQGRPPAAVPVRSVMSRPVWAADADDPVAQAEELMRTKQVRRLPVTDALGGLVGMVALSDLARAAATGVWSVAAGHVARSLSAISRPRSPAPAPPAGKVAGG